MGIEFSAKEAAANADFPIADKVILFAPEKGGPPESSGLDLVAKPRKTFRWLATEDFCHDCADGCSECGE